MTTRGIGDVVSDIISRVFRRVRMRTPRVSRFGSNESNNKRILDHEGVRYSVLAVEQAINVVYSDEPGAVTQAVQALFTDMEDTLQDVWVTHVNNMARHFDRDTCRHLITSGRWDEIAADYETDCKRALRRVLMQSTEYWSGEYEIH